LRDHADLAATILWCQKDRVTAAKGKKLRSGDTSGAVSSSTTAEHVHGNWGWASGIEIKTSIHQAAHNKGWVGRVVVEALSDEVELLAGRSVAWLYGDGNEILSEVAGSRVDE
jgi:hypothetical protein